MNRANRKPTPSMLAPGFAVRGTSRVDEVDNVISDVTGGAELVISELRKGKRAVSITVVYHTSTPLRPPCFNADACERVSVELGKRAKLLRAAATSGDDQ